MKKSEIGVFDDVYEMRAWIRELENKGYEVIQISNSDTSIAVLMQKDENKKKTERI